MAEVVSAAVRPRPQVRRAMRESLLVLLGTTLFVCALMWQVVAHLRTTLFGSPASDSAGGVAWLWQMQHEGGYHLFRTVHHTLTGAPFGWQEGTGLNLQWLLPYYPAYVATKVIGEIAAFDLVVLSGYVLSGASMYLLARYLGCVPLVSAWAALVYIVFPRHLVHAQHGSLVHLEVLALLVLALVAAARQPTWRRFGLVGAAALACWLTSGYYGVMALITAVVFSAAAAASTRRRARLLLVGVATAAIAATALVVGLSAIAGVHRDAGLHRELNDLSVYGLRPLELVIPASDNIIFGDRLASFHQAHLHGANPTETTNYLGLLTIALALGWLVFAWRRRATLSPNVRVATPGLVAVAFIGLALAVPSTVVLFGRSWSTPSHLLREVVPAIRVPSRWTLLVMTALLPLAALALQELWTLARRGRSPSRPHAAQLALVGVAAVVSFLELTVSPAHLSYRVGHLPPQYAAIMRTPKGILAEYPLIGAYDYVFWQRRHGRALLNGAPPATQADFVRRVLLDPAAPGTARALALLGVTTIDTDAGALDFRDGVSDVPDARWGSGYELVARFADHSSVWRVTAKPAPALVTLPRGFGEAIALSGHWVAYPLLAGEATLELIAKAPAIIRVVFDASAGTINQPKLRIGALHRSRTFTLARRKQIAILVAIPRGRSRLFLQARPVPSPKGPLVLLSAPFAERTSAPPDVQAELVSANPGF